MINLDFLQFDQTNIWFFVLSALGLIRERRILPFVIVALGNLVHGSLPAALLAGLILWHRMDVPAPKWVQLKDALGLFFIFAASVAPEPFQQFAICFGALMISLSFGKGELGIIPAVLLLRQFVPHPADLEILMGIAGLYWVAAEGLRLSKTPKENLVRSILEVLCSLGVLVGLKELFFHWAEEPVLIALGVGMLVVMIAIASVVHWRGDRFWALYRKTKTSLGLALTFGDRFISSNQPWNEELKADDFTQIQGSFDRLFILTVITLVLLGAFFVISRGGLS